MDAKNPESFANIDKLKHFTDNFSNISLVISEYLK